MIGVLGGSFDPVHNGHLRLAIEAREALGLAEVRLIPLHAPNHRAPPVASGAQRLAMLRVATAGEPGLVVDDRELRRGGVSYTVETLGTLRAEVGHTPIVLILGMDAFRGLTAWHQWQRLPGLAHIAVAERPGASPSLPAELSAWAETIRVNGTGQFRHQAHGGLGYFAMPQLEIASSRIRPALAAGRSVRGLVPDPVLALIADERLYRQP
jgi:nicotinate-nucleotide adenylyltransferase